MWLQKERPKIQGKYNSGTLALTLDHDIACVWSGSAQGFRKKNLPSLIPHEDKVASHNHEMYSPTFYSDAI